MQGLRAFYYTKGFGNFNQEMNNTLQSALSGSTETYTIQFKKNIISSTTSQRRSQNLGLSVNGTL